MCECANVFKVVMQKFWTLSQTCRQRVLYYDFCLTGTFFHRPCLAKGNLGDCFSRYLQSHILLPKQQHRSTYGAGTWYSGLRRTVRFIVLQSYSLSFAVSIN